MTIPKGSTTGTNPASASSSLTEESAKTEAESQASNTVQSVQPAANERPQTSQTSRPEQSTSTALSEQMSAALSEGSPLFETEPQTQGNEDIGNLLSVTLPEALSQEQAASSEPQKVLLPQPGLLRFGNEGESSSRLLEQRAMLKAKAARIRFSLEPIAEETEEMVDTESEMPLSASDSELSSPEQEDDL